MVRSPWPGSSGSPRGWRPRQFSRPPAAAARRVVSLIPATTELLFAIGAGPVVVGRTAWCDYPAAAAEVPNLGGKPIRLKIPPTTQNGQVFRLKGHGMPLVGKAGHHGDLYATVEAELPR